MRKLQVFVLLSLLLQVAAILAADIQGSKDHPLLSRYPGAEISRYAVTDYEEYQFPTDVLKKKKLPTQSVYGTYTTIVYRLPKTLSTLQVMRNYDDAFKKAKLEKLFSCSQKDCGFLMPKFYVQAQGEAKTSRYLGVDVYNATDRSDYRFYSGKLKRKGKDVYVSFMVLKSGSQVSAFLDVLQARDMKSGLVSVHPEALTDKIEATKTEKHQDVSGSKDHPLISRYPGAYIARYSVTEHEMYQFPTGPMQKKTLPLQQVQGRYTTIVYQLPKSLSTIQVLRNYEQAFDKAKVKKVLSCNQSSCGLLLPKFYVLAQSGGRQTASRYLGVDVYNATDRSDYRFWSGTLSHNDKKVYITFMVMKHGGRVSAFVDVLEAGQMETGLVSFNLESLSDAIENQGKAVLSGIYFDTDKATLKPQSDASMKVIAQYLKKHPKHHVYIVGHTDNQGGYKHNLSLSKMRADTVVNTLAKQYKIAKQRLTPVGVGPVSPSANNNSDNTRQVNRRVEMVLK